MSPTARSATASGAGRPGRRARSPRSYAAGRHRLAVGRERRVRLHGIERVGQHRRGDRVRLVAGGAGRLLHPHRTPLPRRERVSPNAATVRASTRRKSSRSTPSPPGTCRRAEASGPRSVRERAGCATATIWASRPGHAPMCSSAPTPPAPPSPWPTFMSGELEAEAGSRILRLRDRGRGPEISSDLPTMRGRDWRAGFAWSAPVKGARVPVSGLQAPDRRRAGGRTVGGDAARCPWRAYFDPRLSSDLGNAEGVVRPRRLRAQLLGPFRRRPLRPRRGPARIRPEARHASRARRRRRIRRCGHAGRGRVRPVEREPTSERYGPLRVWSGIRGTALSDEAWVSIFARRPSSRARLELYDRPRDRLRALRFDLRHRF